MRGFGLRRSGQPYFDARSLRRIQRSCKICQVVGRTGSAGASVSIGTTSKECQAYLEKKPSPIDSGSEKSKFRLDSPQMRLGEIVFATAERTIHASFAAPDPRHTLLNQELCSW